MSGLPSDEVVDDYKNSLDDLITNDRISIGNLTVIAKECVDHAQAIARVLENHILRVTPPVRKLPAFYVLDSIAKNVGTPYTIYFGKNLFHTYMSTFASVDSNVRRKLDEMRKTWSQPVPGSQSTYPVFQKTVTSKIDDAMDSWARKQVQHSALPGPPRSMMPQMQQYRNTPTPPQTNGAQQYPGYQQTPVNGANGIQHHPQIPYQNGQASQFPAPVPTPQAYTPSIPQAVPQPMSTYPTPPVVLDIKMLNSDIDDLIVDAQISSYSNPMDKMSQQKLASLQSLKELVESGTLSQRDLTDVRKSISEQLNARARSRKPPSPQPPAQPLQQPYPQHPTPTPIPAPAPAPAVFNPAAIADLLRMTAPGARPTPPPVPYNPPAVPIQTPSIPMQAENPLIAQLRASGLLPSAPTPPGLAAFSTPPMPVMGSAPTTLSTYVKFSSQSFKTPRPELLKTLIGSKPNRCPTCGRRFTADDAGREKKARHLDWHFRTKTRTADAERRGIHRSWYVDEREWIKSREYEDDGGPADEGANGNKSPGGTSSTGVGGKKKKEAFIRVPNDAKLRSEPCPICQEKFENMWSEELQDFIWKDAVQVATKGAAKPTRVYHATCLEEATRDRETQLANAAAAAAATAANGQARTGTPDSVLGKRKMEAEVEGGKKIKVET